MITNKQQFKTPNQSASQRPTGPHILTRFLLRLGPSVCRPGPLLHSTQRHLPLLLCRSPRWCLADKSSLYFFSTLFPTHPLPNMLMLLISLLLPLSLYSMLSPPPFLSSQDLAWVSSTCPGWTASPSTLTSVGPLSQVRRGN